VGTGVPIAAVEKKKGATSNMAKEELIDLEGKITHCGAGGIFRVSTGNNHEVLAKLSGRMRKNRIRVVLGDEVTVSVSPYDSKRGLITFRKR